MQTIPTILIRISVAWSVCL